jgi:hypothetical protein
MVSVCVPTLASASTAEFVSNTKPISSPGNSCEHPGYNAIQPAINVSGAGGTVTVCPGSGPYTEQLTITKPLKLTGTATVKLPQSPGNSTTACDMAKGTESYPPDQDEVSICTGGTVTIIGLSFEASWPSSTCDESLYGILVAGGATLDATNVTMDGAGAQPINGCQGGVGIQVGMAWTQPNEVGHAVFKNVTVTSYQKNGVTVDGSGSSASMKGITVTGAGPTPETAQNGIQVSNGASAAIKSAHVSANECNNSNCGANAFEKTQATGILFYGAARGVVTKSTISENDIGVYFDSTSPTQPSSPEVTISKDKFIGNRYEGLALDKGDAAISKSKIKGPGNIGIDLFQYAEQEYAPNSSAVKTNIEEMSQAAVEVQTDNEPGDKPGNFTISKSFISNNATEVIDPSTTFTVTRVNDK